MCLSNQIVETEDMKVVSMCLKHLETLIKRLKQSDKGFLEKHTTLLLNKAREQDLSLYLESLPSIFHLDSPIIEANIEALFNLFYEDNFPILMANLPAIVESATRTKNKFFFNKLAERSNLMRRLFSCNRQWRAKIKFFEHLSRLEIPMNLDKKKQIFSMMAEMSREEPNQVRFALIDCYCTMAALLPSYTAKKDIMLKLNEVFLNDSTNSFQMPAAVHLCSALLEHFSLRFVSDIGTIEDVLFLSTITQKTVYLNYLSCVVPIVLAANSTEMKKRIFQVVSKFKNEGEKYASFSTHFLEMEANFKADPSIYQDLLEQDQEKQMKEDILNESYISTAKQTSSIKLTQTKIPSLRRSKQVKTEKLRAKPFLLSIDSGRKSSREVKRSKEKKIILKR